MIKLLELPLMEFLDRVTIFHDHSRVTTMDTSIATKGDSVFIGLENKKELKGKQLLSEVKQELVEEEKGTLKDFIKGAYRLSLEKQKEISRLQGEVKQIEKAIDEATSGNWEHLAEIKIPARFFDEKTLRQHNKSLLSGSEELRFVDLYVE